MTTFAALGDMGLSMMGSRHVLTITYPDPDETLLETPEALPTSEPETPQIAFTIGAAHLPNIGGASAVWSPALYAAGKNDTAGAVTLSYRLMKNGASVQTGTQSVTAGRYWTVSGYNYYDSAVGDTIALSLWANAAGLDWRYNGFAVLPTRLDVSTAASSVLYRVQYTLARKPVLTLGTPGLLAASRWYLYNGDMPFDTNNAGALTLPVLAADPDYKFGRMQYGDTLLTNSSHGAQTTTYPYYMAYNVPTQIVYYPLSVR